MALDPARLPQAALTFLDERHLASLVTIRPDGTPHVVAIAFTYDPETCVARVITSRGSRKVRNVRANGRVALCQVDGRRWLSLEGEARVVDEPAAVAEAVRRYARRYRQPAENPERVALEVRVERVLGRA